MSPMATGLGRSEDYKVSWVRIMTSRGPHYDADAAVAVPEDYWKQLSHFISYERYHEL